MISTVYRYVHRQSLLGAGAVPNGFYGEEDSMRRSVRAVLGSLVGAAMCAAAPVAAADQGELIVGGTVYSNPSGCIMLGTDTVRHIENKTSTVVTVYTDASCQGIATAVLRPGDSGTYTGKSVVVS
ncbi:hypothetical protein ACFYV7_16965 [Nocardia suismassiliense]|uniref:Secreted protein n=1 Tax=Nocardia suismassiliense TaxID=2077092 RepID=A0ABW6QTY2_9NOCA